MCLATTPTPRPQLTVSDAVAVEGDKERFTVKLSFPATQDIYVPYWTADGTAASGTDYTGVAYAPDSSPAQKKLKIDAGYASGTITIPTSLSWQGSADRTFALHLGDVTGATVNVVKYEATGIIQPDPLTLRIEPDFNSDGVVDATDEFANMLDPTIVNVEGDGPRTLVDLSASLNIPVEHIAGLKFVLPNVPGVLFWSSATATTPITPDANGNIVCSQLASTGQYQGPATLYVSMAPDTGDPTVSLELVNADSYNTGYCVTTTRASLDPAPLTGGLDVTQALRNGFKRLEDLLSDNCDRELSLRQKVDIAML